MGDIRRGLVGGGAEHGGHGHRHAEALPGGGRQLAGGELLRHRLLLVAEHVLVLLLHEAHMLLRRIEVAGAHSAQWSGSDRWSWSGEQTVRSWLQAIAAELWTAVDKAIGAQRSRALETLCRQRLLLLGLGLRLDRRRNLGARDVGIVVVELLQQLLLLLLELRALALVVEEGGVHLVRVAGHVDHSSGHCGCGSCPGPGPEARLGPQQRLLLQQCLLLLLLQSGDVLDAAGL